MRIDSSIRRTIGGFQAKDYNSREIAYRASNFPSAMKTYSRYFEKLILLTLILLFAFTFYFWGMVESAHKKQHNTLGIANIHVPTADLFLWAAFALIVYSLTRIWGAIAGRVFELPEDRAAVWHFRLQTVRAMATLVLFGLTLRTIHTYVPDFIDKLPWP